MPRLCMMLDHVVLVCNLCIDAHYLLNGIIIVWVLHVCDVLLY